MEIPLSGDGFVQARLLGQNDENFKAIIDNWTDDTNPLADSFVLKVKNIERVKDTVMKLKQVSYT